MTQADFDCLLLSLQDTDLLLCKKIMIKWNISKRNLKNSPRLGSKLLKCVLAKNKMRPKSGKKEMKILRTGAKNKL